MTPSQIGRYQILGWLGQGGMGQVYRARDPDLDREVVLKIVTLPDLGSDDTWRQRFKREVQAAGRLNHPHIVTVYDVGLEHEPPYVVMELLTGGTLRDYLQQGPLPWRETLTLLRPLVQALAFAHQAGVVHRDVKPGNVMFSGGESSLDLRGRPTGLLKLVDFGLAQQQQAEQLTQTGAIFGTPTYLSPEQARGEMVDGRTDIFALGLIFFEAITGHNPLDKGSVFAALSETLSETPLDLTPLMAKAPTGVIGLIERAVAKNREQRYPTCETLLVDLDRCLADTPDPLTRLAATRLNPWSPGRVSPAGPLIQKGPQIILTPEIERVLQVMFSRFTRLVIEAEFGQGLSGGRVFRVRPVELGGRVQLPAVVKVAPLALIHQEWQAYQTWVAHTLPGVAGLESAPALPPESLWDGLCYTLVGWGAFEVQSLATYYQQANAEDLRWLLSERLYQMIGIHWWLEHQLDRTFQMQADYDRLLPVNLLLQPTNLPPGTEVPVIKPGQLPASPPVKGEIVQLERFIVTELDLDRRQITLNIPPASASTPSASYRLRLVEVADLKDYRAGQMVDSLTGRVVATRHDILLAEAGRALPETAHLSARQLAPPLDLNVWSSHFRISPPPLTLPNPLLAYQDLLYAFLPVNLSLVHGDLNMENILVDPETRHINLIDFATVRQGHSLHDLLRLETDVVVKLLPAVLQENNLPLMTIYAIYQQLRLLALQTDPSTLFERFPPALEKILTMLVALRKMAQGCLFNPNDWREYYQGLLLYLLGALKFKNLDDLPIAPLPKQIAFWGAATLVELLNTPVTLPPEPGQILNDRYQIIQLLGMGGMGAVYKGRDLTLQREVAIKIMHPHFARSPELQQRFLREARAAARLSHPGIVPIFDFGQEHALLYIIMELIPGNNLQQVLQQLWASQRWLRLVEAVELVRQLCLALDYAHRQEVWHRDLKPSNIMLKVEPSQSLPYQPVITDLGLAKLLLDEFTTAIEAPLGTPAYMSPEQAMGQPVDARSDIYALGILLYELITGHLPFPATTIAEALHYHPHEAPPAPQSLRPDLPASLAQIVLQALAKNPADRFPTAMVMAQALAQVLPEAAAISQAPTELGEPVTLLKLAQARQEDRSQLVELEPTGTTPITPPSPPPHVVLHEEKIGGDKITVGNIYGSGVIIGREGRLVISQGLTGNEIVQLFEAIYRQIEARPADPDVDKEEVRETVSKIQQEVAKGEQANPKKVERWLNSLAGIAPDISKATATGLTQLTTTISPSIRQIAAKAGSATE